MKVVAVEEIERQTLAVDYRKVYRGNAVLSIGGDNHRTVPIEFTLELTAMGGYDVALDFLKTPEFPLVPAIRILKDYIKTLNKEGHLP